MKNLVANNCTSITRKVKMLPMYGSDQADDETSFHLGDWLMET